MSFFSIPTKSQKILSHFQRFEFKYHLNPIKARALVEELLSGHMILDDKAKNGTDVGYIVSSIYFDSPDLKCYRDNEAGERNRFKIRLRTYNDKPNKDSLFFLEIKRKRDFVTIKDRVVLPHFLVDGILKNDISFFDLLNHRSEIIGDQAILEEVIGKVSLFKMKPVALISYNRIPLVGRYNDRFRVTIDHNIKVSSNCDFSNNDSFSRVFSGKVVLEVKFDNTLPIWFHRVLRRYGLVRHKFSKYFNGVNVLRNNLNNI